jgi:putative CocE/NonD family hydrolase
MNRRTVGGLAAGFAVLAGLVGIPAQAAPTTMCNVAIPMSDGMDLRANITTPGPASEAAPTVLTVTGYNKDLANPSGQCSAGDSALVAAGYNVITVDDRGTGSSGGRWDIWSPRTQQDYPELLDWIDAQPWSNGKLATTGGSYLAITSLLVAATGHPSVKAVWADVPMADAYRDVTYFGGNLDTTFMPVWFGFTQGTNTNPPTDLAQGEDPAAVAAKTADHVAYGPWQVGANLVKGALTGEQEGEFAPYDSPMQRFRSPAEQGAKIRAAVFWTGGWFDIFQRGEPFLWRALSATPPGGKKWVQAPIYHTGGDDHWDTLDLGYGSKSATKIAWFDHWLKGVDNGIDRIDPIHLWQNGADAWETASNWPVPGTDWTGYYLSTESSGSGAASLLDGSLLAGAPPATPKQATLPFVPVGGICNRSTLQWAAGPGAGSGQPCETNQRTSEATTLTFTTDALASPLHLAGPMALDLWAALDRPDTSFYTALTDVAPDGTSTQISSGGLNASHRALDQKKSWRNSDGDIILPWHPFTQAAQQRAPLYTPTKYSIEVYPSDWVLQPGHRLRLVVGTADTPHYAVPQDQLQNMLGGTIRLLTGPAYPSRLLLPVQP